MGLLNWQLIRVRGSSMQPTLEPGTWVIVDRVGRRRQLPGRFDLVRFVDPVRPAAWCIKRVVGLPGEQVRLAAAGLFVNGEHVPEPHAAGAPAQEEHCWQPAAGHCIVLGDNREGSTDSRRFGPLPLTLITGTVRRRLWGGGNHRLQGGGRRGG